MNQLIRSAKLSKHFVTLGRSNRPDDRVRGLKDAAKPDVALASVLLSSEPPASRQAPDISTAVENHAAGHTIDLYIPTHDVSAIQAAESTMATAWPIPSEEEYQQRLEKELAQLRQAAEEQGYAAGAQAARQETQAEYAAELDSLRALIQSVRKAMEQELDGLTEIGAEIVFEAVAKIVGASYADKQGVIAVVREVIRHAKDRSHLVIRVNAADHPVLSACVDDIASGMGSGQIEVVADDRVGQGGCLLETPAGSLDGRLEIQMQLLRDTLLGAKARRSEVAAGES